jgi:putative membrane protein
MANMPGMPNMPGMRGAPGIVAAHTHAVSHAMPGMRMGGPPPIDAHTILTDWQVSLFPIAVAVGLVALAVWYLLATRTLAARGRRWSPWRTLSFLGGLLAVELALGSSVAVLAGYTFTAHIAQHLLLMVIAPPLAALGAPMTLALQTSGRPTKRRLLRILRSRPFQLISNPIPVFFLYYLSMYAFFLTGALGYAMTHMWVMDLINLGFLAGATLFWWPMVGIDPIPHWNMNPGLKLLNLLIGVPVESFLGVALLMKSTPAAPMYTLATTHMGGGVLWVATEVATVAALVPIYAQWTRQDARAARRIDARIASGQTIEPPVFDGHGLFATLRALRRD